MRRAGMRRTGCEAEGRGSVLEGKDAVSTGAGMLLGLTLFAGKQSDILFGGALFVVLLLQLSTPEMLDIETQYSLHVAETRCCGRRQRALLLMLAWPQFWSAMAMVASQSSWSHMVAGYCAAGYVIVDKSFAGVVAAGIVGACYVFCSPLADEPAAFGPAMAVNVACWAASGLCLLTADRQPRHRAELPLLAGRFLRMAVLSPLLATIDLVIACGKRETFAKRVRANVANIVKEGYITDSDEECSS